MTDQQINAAIHAALGNPMGCPRCSEPECAYNSGLNYCDDLNAMHEAERTLTHYGQIHAYVNYLQNRDDGHTHLLLLETHITARQRAEAFLRTLGKWEEKE